MTSKTCNICCENYNKSLNSKVTCEIGSCGFEACKTCVRTYLLNTTNDPHCMNCKNPWTNNFLVNNLNKSYMENDFKKHRKQLLVDKEISRTSELMNLVERTKLLEEHQKELITLNEEFVKMKKLLNEKYQQVNEKKCLIHRIKNGEDTEKERKKFIMPCPADNCRGYLSSQYKCEVCKLFTCPDCFEVIGYSKDEPHECKEDNIKSAELIKKETKGCPKCGVRIFKIEGCDQMWCTQCHTGFSWKRGTIENRVHNPHYYEWQRQNGGGRAPRNVGDFECGRDIGDHNIVPLLTQALGKLPANPIKNNIITIIRNTIHLHEVNGQWFRPPNEDVNQDARIKYITKKYDDKKFASIIHKNNKAIAKKQDIFNVIQLQHQGVTDIVFRIIDSLKPTAKIHPMFRLGSSEKRIVDADFILRSISDEIQNLYEEFETLTSYSNSLLREHQKTYQCKLWRLELLPELRRNVFH